MQEENYLRVSQWAKQSIETLIQSMEHKQLEFISLCLSNIKDVYNNYNEVQKAIFVNNLNLPSENGLMLLHSAAKLVKDEGIVTELLHLGCSLTATQKVKENKKEEYLAWEYAISLDNIPALRAILKFIVNNDLQCYLNQTAFLTRDNYQYNLLLWAVVAAKPESVSLILEFFPQLGRQKHKLGYTPIMAAIIVVAMSYNQGKDKNSKKFLSPCNKVVEILINENCISLAEKDNNYHLNCKNLAIKNSDNLEWDREWTVKDYVEAFLKDGCLTKNALLGNIRKLENNHTVDLTTANAETFNSVISQFPIEVDGPLSREQVQPEQGNDPAKMSLAELRLVVDSKREELNRIRAEKQRLQQQLEVKQREEQVETRPYQALN